MPSNRDAILQAVRKNRPPAAELPDLNRTWTTYPDPLQQFTTALEGVGGQAVLVDGPAELEVRLRQVPSFETAQRVCSLVPDVASRNLVWDDVQDPHELQDVDYAVVPAEFAVAENAAIWVLGKRVRHRALLFLTQHLALVVPRSQIVHNMHEAYARIGAEGAESGLARGAPDFGVFISGPSKTADIEQSLVIGAHGARSLTVLLVN